VRSRRRLQGAPRRIVHRDRPEPDGHRRRMLKILTRPGQTRPRWWDIVRGQPSRATAPRGDALGPEDMSWSRPPTVPSIKARTSSRWG
jgi:hypothetical protein